MSEKASIYTDGGCSGNPGPGAWAFAIMSRHNTVCRSGSEPSTTNNRMELEAVIHALGYVHGREELKPNGINMYTDSQYVKRGITEWIGRWQSNGWKNAAKKPVKNQDLWKKLLSLSGQLDIIWHWVRGHSGNEMNELCDRLVKKEIQNLL